ncbi:MAG: CAAX prenyl protease-related protein [Candidatus Eisenbacteria bacterium]
MIRFDQTSPIPWIAPFLLFIAFLGLRRVLPFGPEIEYPLRVAVVALSILALSRPVLSLRPRRTLASLGFGLFIFALWIAPDQIAPGYRHHWLFSNSITGKPESTLAEALRHDPVFLAWRVAGTALVVPIVEELFWRGFLLRWLTRSNFSSLALGDWSRSAFWLTALLFASEHGPYWEVGLLTGLGLNLWLRWTRSLADCILAHAVANAALAAYVVGAGHWEYWL